MYCTYNARIPRALEACVDYHRWYVRTYEPQFRLTIACLRG